MIEDSFTPFRNFFSTLFSVIRSPKKFFASLPFYDSIYWPLSFALICHWIGSVMFAGFFPIFGAPDWFDFSRLSRGYSRVEPWMMATGSAILDPISTFISILVASLLIFLGARIFITPGKNRAPTEINYQTILRIVCFGFAPTLFYGLPFGLGTLAGLYSIVLTAIGIAEVYQVGFGRGLIVTLFPKLVTIGIVAAFFFFSVSLILGLFLGALALNFS